MDPENHDPLKHSDFRPHSRKSFDDSSEPRKSHSHDRDPHWDELGRGTSKVPKGAAEILSSYFDDRQIEKAGTYHSFFSNWRDLAGLDLASHSRPRDIRNDTLIIDADHPGWVQMIYMKKALILKNIRRAFPQIKIRDIRVLYHPDRTFSGLNADSGSPETSSNSAPSTPMSPLRTRNSVQKKPARSSTEPAGNSASSNRTEKANNPDSSKSADSEKKRLDEALKKLGKHIEGV